MLLRLSPFSWKLRQLLLSENEAQLLSPPSNADLDSLILVRVDGGGRLVVVDVFVDPCCRRKASPSVDAVAVHEEVLLRRRRLRLRPRRQPNHDGDLPRPNVQSSRVKAFKDDASLYPVSLFSVSSFLFFFFFLVEEATALPLLSLLSIASVFSIDF